MKMSTLEKKSNYLKNSSNLKKIRKLKILNKDKEHM